MQSGVEICSTIHPLSPPEKSGGNRGYIVGFPVFHLHDDSILDWIVLFIKFERARDTLPLEIGEGSRNEGRIIFTRLGNRSQQNIRGIVRQGCQGIWAGIDISPGIFSANPGLPASGPQSKSGWCKKLPSATAVSRSGLSHPSAPNEWGVDAFLPCPRKDKIYYLVSIPQIDDIGFRLYDLIKCDGEIRVFCSIGRFPNDFAASCNKRFLEGIGQPHTIRIGLVIKDERAPVLQESRRRIFLRRNPGRNRYSMRERRSAWCSHPRSK